METDSITIVRQYIDHVLSDTACRDAMAARARSFNPDLAHPELTPMLEQLELFVRGTPDLLEAAAIEAEEAGVLAQLQPMLENAAQYFFAEDDLIPDHLGLYGLLDDAYLAQRYLLSASELHQKIYGSPLLGERLRPSVEVIRQWIGESDADQLDQMVTNDIRKLQWKTALVGAGIGLLTWGVISSFTGSGDSGVGSWGNSWEAETSRMAAGMGLSTPW